MGKKIKLQSLALKIQRCQRCPLYQTATQAVPGEGNPQARVMFIGEAPGFYEDREGRPFVGQAGRLLDQLVASIGLTREEVFIANILKHRPPQNRDPLDSEIVACQIWLDEQIAIIEPKLIVTLGRFSMAKFIPGYSISKIHGKVFNKGDKMIMPLFHPAAALRSREVEASLRADFAQIPQILREVEEPKQENLF